MRNAMAVVLALALAVGSGCGGFGAGVKRALTGGEPTAEERAQVGYDIGVIVTNVLLTVTGYAARVAQDKISKKPEATR